MTGWAAAMLASGAVFGATVTYFAWVQIPQWRTMALAEFRVDFARWLHRADALQPLLAVAFLGTTIGFATAATGPDRALASAAATLLTMSLLGSVAVMVPLQRRLAADRLPDPERGRRRWYRGHLARTSLVLQALALATIAAL